MSNHSLDALLERLRLRDMNAVDSLRASGSLRRLRDAGLLEQRGKCKNTYWRPTHNPVDSRLSALSPGFNPGGKGFSPGLASQSPGLTGALSPSLPALPADLEALVRGLGERAGPDDVRGVIRRLCAWQPLRPFDLGTILGRNPEYLQKQYLSAMRRAGELEFTKPDAADPQQAYRAVQQQGEEP